MRIPEKKIEDIVRAMSLLEAVIARQWANQAVQARVTPSSDSGRSADTQKVRHYPRAEAQTDPWLICWTNTHLCTFVTYL